LCSFSVKTRVVSLSSGPGFDPGREPFASGGAALPSGRKLLFGEAIRRKCEPQRRRSQEEMKKCVAPYICTGARSKIARVKRLHLSFRDRFWDGAVSIQLPGGTPLTGGEFSVGGKPHFEPRINRSIADRCHPEHACSVSVPINAMTARQVCLTNYAEGRPTCSPRPVYARCSTVRILGFIARCTGNPTWPLFASIAALCRQRNGSSALIAIVVASCSACHCQPHNFVID
jgi:hypothetical protein